MNFEHAWENDIMVGAFFAFFDLLFSFFSYWIIVSSQNLLWIYAVWPATRIPLFFLGKILFLSESLLQSYLDIIFPTGSDFHVLVSVGISASLFFLFGFLEGKFFLKFSTPKGINLIGLFSGLALTYAFCFILFLFFISIVGGHNLTL
jgi:hypothetical protein